MHASQKHFPLWEQSLMNTSLEILVTLYHQQQNGIYFIKSVTVYKKYIYALDIQIYKCANNSYL